MVKESGKMSKDILVVLDFDGTMVFGDGTHEDFDLLRKFHESRITLAIASRNDMYRLDRLLATLGIDDLFTFVMADFRPKTYQLRHILMLFEEQGIRFSKVFFVDDHVSHIDRMRADEPEVQSLIYGKDISSFADLEALLFN